MYEVALVGMGLHNQSLRAEVVLGGIVYCVCMMHYVLGGIRWHGFAQPATQI